MLLKDSCKNLECKCNSICEVCKCELQDKDYIKDEQGNPLWISNSEGLYLNRFFDEQFPSHGGVTKIGYQRILESRNKDYLLNHSDL